MHNDDKFGKVGAVLGAFALALTVRKQSVQVSPGAAAPVYPDNNVIFRTTFGDTKPMSADNKWANPNRSIFDRTFSSPDKWGQQTIYSAPYNALGVRGIYDAAPFLIFHLYGYVKHGSLWYLLTDTGLLASTAGTFDTGLTAISSLGVSGYTAVTPNADRVSIGAAWDTDLAFQLDGYAEVYGGYI